MKNQNLAAIGYALAAAVFYALNVPCSKLLLVHIPPTVMAAFLYLGAGLGVGILYLFHRRQERPEERLAKADLPYTAGMVLLDILAPILLMLGIRSSTSSNASLLGNFEIVATTIIALLIFHEKVSKRLWAAIGLITLSSIVLTFEGSGSFRFSVGSLLLLGAASCWGLENNCTRKISEKSTYQIVTVKGLCSGSGSLITALILKEPLPEIRYIPAALILGFVAYGLSIFTYIRAQKTLGAAKTSAYYAAAPFIGAFLSFVLVKESLSVRYLTALFIMIAGTVFVVRDTLYHAHTHAHTHTFTHTHDGKTHTHTVTHSHPHAHYLTDQTHTHRHSTKELEKLLTEHHTSGAAHS
ncbi:MAG: DMT family transporter [Oscillospiraceae bacterium]|nr:DMT family transporter [Oscillospiraceae bacterium]